MLTNANKTLLLTFIYSAYLTEEVDLNYTKL